LSLLCSTLAWQRTYREAAYEQETFEREYKRIKLEYESDSKKHVDQEKKSEPKNVKVPQIYFASRTHTQLNQVCVSKAPSVIGKQF
jgi:hypothetical protein